MANEYTLEKLLFRHPYLIDEELAEITPRQIQRQVRRKRHRLDLLFDLPDGLCIAELKITSLTTKDVEQLVRYCEAWRETETLAPFHFLVGKRPRDESRLQTVVAASNFEICLRYVNEHLPAHLVFDETTRRYRPLRSGDSAHNILELHF